MTDRVLRPPLVGLLAKAVGMLALGAVGYGMTLLGFSIGWVILTGSVLVALMFIVIPVSGRHFLRLDDRGFTVGGLVRTREYRWDDVAEFAVAKNGVGLESVVYLLTESGRATHRSNLSRLEATAGYDGELVETYGMTPPALCRLLAEEQAKHLGRRGSGT